MIPTTLTIPKSQAIPASPTSQTPADEQAVRSLMQRWIEASANGDYSALEPLMHPEIVFLTAGNPPMGRDAFQAASRV